VSGHHQSIVFADIDDSDFGHANVRRATQNVAGSSHWAYTASYASANRDERRWGDPEQFDITRESAGHLAFGHGEHACAGMGLARLEGAAVLTALVEPVETIEVDGPPVRRRNNLIRSFRSLPLTVTPKASA
jgi:hypothetical protein